MLSYLKESLAFQLTPLRAERRSECFSESIGKDDSFHTR